MIATSQKIDVKKVDTKKFNDAYFARVDAPADATLVAAGGVSAERKADQVAVDASIIAALGKDAALNGYLGARFNLSNGDRPHNMKF